MKKFYFLLVAILITSMIARSQKKWIGQATGGNWATGANWTGGTAPTAADNVVLDGNITGSITNVANVMVRTLTVTGNSNVTLDYSGGGGARTLTVSNSNGNATLDLTIDFGSQLTISGTNFTGIRLDNNAKASIAGTLAINDGRTYDTDNGNSNTTVTITGRIENNGIIISGNNGNGLSFANGGTYVHTQDGGVVPRASWNANSNCIITNVVNAMPTGFNQEFGNFEWDCPNQIPFTAPALPSFEGQFVNIAGDLIIKSTGTGAVFLTNNSSYFTTVAGDYIQTGGTLVLNQAGGSGVLSLEGNFNMSGGILSRNSPIAGGNSSTIYFDDNNEQTFTKTGGTISGPLDFVVRPLASVNFGTSILDGTTAKFTLQSGGKIITSDPVGLNSAGALGPIQTATRVFDAGADYEFRGAATGVFNTGDSTDIQSSVVRNLIINNPSGSVTLSKPVTIANNPGGPTERLYLKNGALITTTDNILILNDGVQATGTTGQHQYNLNSFVDGPLRKIGDDDFIFPVGKVGFGLHKIGISDPIAGSNNTTAFTAQFFRADPKTQSTQLGAGLVRISSCEYWTLNRTGTNQVNVMLSWENNSSCGGSQYVTQNGPASLRVARLDAAGTWIDEGNTDRTGIAPFFTSGTVTSDTINTFSPFALASSSAAENPLPVVFGDVKAYENNNGVQIEWSNLTEKDVAEYTIERSANGSDFNGIGSQLPTSNQNDKASYSAFDATPAQGTNYYRIKAEETTGKIVYSKILSVSLGKSSYGLRLYPNPVTGNQVTISLSNMKRGQYSLRVVNATGQDVFKKIILNQSNNLTQTLDLPSTIKPGVYNMVITADGYRETKMFIVQ